MALPSERASYSIFKIKIIIERKTGCKIWFISVLLFHYANHAGFYCRFLSEFTDFHLFCSRNRSIAQLAEHVTLNLGVEGSSPSGPTGFLAVPFLGQPFFWGNATNVKKGDATNARKGYFVKKWKGKCHECIKGGCHECTNGIFCEEMKRGEPRMHEWDIL